MLAKLLLDRLNDPPLPEQLEPADKVFAAEFEAAPSLNDAVSEAYRRRLPTTAVRQKHRENFASFKEFCAPNGVDPMQAAGPVVATWLAGLAEGEPRPFKRVREALDAVEYYRWLARRDAFVDAVLAAAAAIEGGPEDGDDGGGKELDGGKEAPAEPEALPLTLAPGPSQD